MSRTTELLKAAADALEDARDPLHESFLRDNEVTFDECMELAEMLALGARLIAYGIENPEVMKGAVNGAHMAAAYQTLNAALRKWQPVNSGGKD